VLLGSAPTKAARVSDDETPLIDLSNVGWNIRTVLEPDAHVAWGDWGLLSLCPNMTFAYGFALKVIFNLI
jgi:hypothetical protein